MNQDNRSVVVREPLARLLSRVEYDPNSGCWLWSGALSSHGYGNIQICNRHTTTHRLSYEEHHGAVPAGMSVMHKCDTPACVNPDHLRVGSHRENMLDAAQKRRFPERRVMRRMKAEERQAIADLAGSPIRLIARQFRRDPQTIRRIFASVTARTASNAEGESRAFLANLEPSQ